MHLPTNAVTAAALAIVLLGAIGQLFAAEPKRDKYDDIVDRFIEYDIGELRGEEGAQAYQAFLALNDERAIPALVRGVNKAARIQASCPIIVISNKLNAILAGTKNRRMLQHAIDNLDSTGEGVVYASYVDSLRDAAARTLGVAPPGAARTLRGGGTISQLRRSRTPPEKWSREDVVEAAVQDEGTLQVAALEQLRDREGPEYTQAFAEAIRGLKDDVKPLARGLLAQRLLNTMTEEELAAALTDQSAEMRLAAARAISYKGAPLCVELARAVVDKDPLVAAEAHAALVKLSGQDLGPEADARVAEQFLASKRWEKWIAERQQVDEGAP